MAARGIEAARRATVRVCDGAGNHRGQGLLLDLEGEGAVVLTCHHVIAPLEPEDLRIRTTQIPACLWFLSRDKAAGRFRNRSRETLFMDARQMGHLVDRTHRELSDEEIGKIAGTYHAWRGEAEAGAYEDVPGFAKSANLEEIAGHGWQRGSRRMTSAGRSLRRSFGRRYPRRRSRRSPGTRTR